MRAPPPWPARRCHGLDRIDRVALIAHAGGAPPGRDLGDVARRQQGDVETTLPSCERIASSAEASAAMRDRSGCHGKTER